MLFIVTFVSFGCKTESGGYHGDGGRLFTDWLLVLSPSTILYRTTTLNRLHHRVEAESGSSAELLGLKTDMKPHPGVLLSILKILPPASSEPDLLSCAPACVHTIKCSNSKMFKPNKNPNLVSAFIINCDSEKIRRKREVSCVCAARSFSFCVNLWSELRGVCLTSASFFIIKQNFWAPELQMCFYQPHHKLTCNLRKSQINQVPLFFRNF